MKKLIVSLTTIALLITFVSISPALAHKVRVFAYESGGEIIAEAKFNNDRPAKNSTIVITNKEDGNVLLQGLTDSQGIFRFDIPPLAKDKRMSLNIILDVGEGHQGSWLLKPSDYLVDQGPHPHLPERQTQPPIKKVKKQPDSADYSEIERVVEQIIIRELTPVKKMLAENREQKMTLQDILGGLGYIFGLAGIAAYFQSKK